MYMAPSLEDFLVAGGAEKLKDFASTMEAGSSSKRSGRSGNSQAKQRRLDKAAAAEESQRKVMSMVKFVESTGMLKDSVYLTNIGAPQPAVASWHR